MKVPIHVRTCSHKDARHAHKYDARTRMYMYVHTHTRMHAYACAPYAQVRIHFKEYAQVCEVSYTYVHVRTQMYDTHTNVDAHTLTYMYIHRRTRMNTYVSLGILSVARVGT